MTDIAKKIGIKIEEKKMNIKTVHKQNLVIYDVNEDEIELFKEFIKTSTPNEKGYEAISILIDNYKKTKGE